MEAAKMEEAKTEEAKKQEAKKLEAKRRPAAQASTSVVATEVPAKVPAEMATPALAPTDTRSNVATASSSVSSSAGSQMSGICTNVRIWIQVYGPEGREQVQAMRSKWINNGAKVPPVEDVSATALRQGRNPPFQVRTPTLIYHDGAAKNCADELAKLAGRADSKEWQVRGLGLGFKPSQATIEVWLPTKALRDPAGL